MVPRLFASTVLLIALCSGATASGRPVVVELFTSEGCSSCPPADAILTELAHERADVLPLAFHITYWNQLGWTDPFSLPAATARQARYGDRFGDGSYTPELVVDGRRGVVGSERQAVESAIAAARVADAVSAPLTVVREADGVSIRVDEGQGSGDIVLIGYDPEHRTAVGRGENSGRLLTESNIVRSIRVVGQWTGASVRITVPVPAGERVAVLLEARDGGIIGAATAAF